MTFLNCCAKIKLSLKDLKKELTMKKLSTLVFALLLALSLVFSLSSCSFLDGLMGGEDDGDGEFVGELSEKEWQAAFDFDNVTIKMSIKTDGALSEMYVKYFDGKEYMSGDGKNYVESENAGNFRLLFDFSEYQELFTNNNDGYVAERISLETSDGTIEPYDVRVTFNAKKRVSSVMFDVEVSEGQLVSYAFYFSDYGKTDLNSGSSGGSSSDSGFSEIEPSVSLPFSEGSWREMFDFGNVTIRLNSYSESGNYSVSLKCCDGKVFISENGTDYEESTSSDYLFDYFDFSEFFGNFSYINGEIVADELCLTIDGETVVADSICVSVGGDLRLNSVRYNATFAGERTEFIFDFSDRGETEAPEAVDNKMSRDEWNMLFYFDNVTVRHYDVYGGLESMKVEKFFCNGFYYTSENGYEEQDLTSATAFMYNFSNHYELFSIVNGKYYAGELTVSFGEDAFIYYDVSLYVEDGKITRMEFDYCIVGGSSVPTSCVVKFTDYGKTVSPEVGGSYIDISEKEWKELFLFEKTNFSAVLSVTNGTSERETEYYKVVDGMEYRSFDGDEYEESNIFLRNLPLYDFSEYYSFFEGSDGYYFAEKFPLYEGSYTYYKNVVVGVDKNGNLKTVDYDVTYFCGNGEINDVPEEDWNTSSLYLYNYGTTEAPVIDSGSEENAPITEDEWRAAFDFENVTVSGWAEFSGRNQSVVLRFADGRVFVGYDGEDPTDGGDPLNYIPTFDFSAYFSEFEYDSELDLYYADTFMVQGHDIIDMYITLDENGKLKSLSYYYDFMNAGYTDGMMYYEYYFADYGATVIDEGNGAQLRYWFSSSEDGHIVLDDPIHENFFGAEDSYYSYLTGANDMLWEPGMTYVMYFSAHNYSPLVLKFTPYIDVTYINKNYNECIKIDVVDGARYGDVVSWSGGEYICYGENVLELESNTLEPDTDYYFALVIRMDESAGYEFMDGYFSFDIGVEAYPVEAEEDSFGPSYDEIGPGYDE